MFLRSDTQLADALDSKWRVPNNKNIRVEFGVRDKMPAYSSNSSNCVKIPALASSASSFVIYVTRASIGFAGLRGLGRTGGNLRPPLVPGRFTKGGGCFGIEYSGSSRNISIFLEPNGCEPKT